MMGKLGVAAALVLATSLVTGAQAPAGRRADVQRSLEQRYRLTVIGPGMLGLSGERGTVRRAGGVVELRREGLSGSLDPDQPASFSIRAGTAERFRGRQDAALPVGEKLYVHSVYVGSDVVTLGLLSARRVSTEQGSDRLWVSLNFFFPAATLADADVGSVFRVLDQWLLPEEALRPVFTEAAPVEAAPVAAAPPAPASSRAPAELKPGMSREEVVAALGPPQREVSFGARTWLSYAGLVVLLEQGKLVSVDRSGQPPAKVSLVSEPDGADVYLDGSFVSSTPATLELPAGTYRVSVRLAGFQEWQRELRALGGSEITLRARLEK